MLPVYFAEDIGVPKTDTAIVPPILSRCELENHDITIVSDRFFAVGAQGNRCACRSDHLACCTAHWSAICTTVAALRRIHGTLVFMVNDGPQCFEFEGVVILSTTRLAHKSPSAAGAAATLSRPHITMHHSQVAASVCQFE